MNISHFVLVGAVCILANATPKIAYSAPITLNCKNEGASGGYILNVDINNRIISQENSNEYEITQISPRFITAVSRLNIKEKFDLDRYAGSTSGDTMVIERSSGRGWISEIGCVMEGVADNMDEFDKKCNIKTRSNTFICNRSLF